MTEDRANALEERVEALIQRLEESRAATYDLGTPHPVVAGPTAELIALGRSAVPSILDRLEVGSARVQAHLVLALREIGDRAAAGPLRALCSRCEARAGSAEVGPWERSLLAECREAVERLGTPPEAPNGEGG